MLVTVVLAQGIALCNADMQEPLWDTAARLWRSRLRHECLLASFSICMTGRCTAAFFTSTGAPRASHHEYWSFGPQTLMGKKCEKAVP